MASPAFLWNRMILSLSARSRRELALLGLSLIAVSYFVADRLVYSSQAQRLGLAEQKLRGVQAALAGQKSALEMLTSGSLTDQANAAAQSELSELRKQARLIDAVISDAKGSSPVVGMLIRNLIEKQHPGVTLLSLKSIPVKPFIVAGQAAAAQKGAQDLYRHGVEVELTGSYLDLLGYLRALESRSQGLLWSDARLAATNFPQVTLRVTIFVLSNRPDAFIS